MKITDIENSLALLRECVLKKISEIGSTEAEKITGFRQPHLSAFVNGKVNYKHDKILQMAKKLFPGGEI